MDAHKKSWDFTLMMLTMGLLGSLGVQSFVGTLYVWWAERTVQGFQQFGYAGFVQTMNLIAAPQVIALVVVMGLCVPKRLFDRTTLIAVSAGMLVAGLAAWAVTGSMQTGLAIYLALAGFIQIGVVALTMAGARSPSYLTEGRLTKTGSGLLHLGFIVFMIVIVALQRSAFMLPMFWLATLLSLGGTLMSFYADKLAFKKRVIAP